jgi:hypothetical protein
VHDLLEQYGGFARLFSSVSSKLGALRFLEKYSLDHPSDFSDRPGNIYVFVQKKAKS